MTESVLALGSTPVGRVALALCVGSLLLVLVAIAVDEVIHHQLQRAERRARQMSERGTWTS